MVFTMKSKSIVKIGKIPYLNALPFYLGRKADICLCEGTPKELVELARKGKIDAAPFPVVGLWTLKNFTPFDEFCIAVESAAKSVILFSRYKNLNELAGKRIGISEETLTSFFLLKTILKIKENTTAHLERGFLKNDAARLLIGDKALAYNGLKEEFIYQFDLAELWKRWQGVPFVFARWAVNKNLDRLTKQKISNFLNESLSKFRNNPWLVLHKFPSNDKFDPLTYLHGFKYKMGKEEKKGLQIFKSIVKNFFPDR